MLQILQDFRSGRVEIADVPAPALRAGHVLIASSLSLVSSGTERMLTKFAKGNLVQKALQQPERVQQVLQNIRTNGLVETISAVRSKLDQPISLGYSNVGRVLAAGSGVDGFTPGDRILSNGPHAEMVCVPKNLCAKIPAGVNDEVAAFAVVGAIALQGIRLIAPSIGERIVVVGLGLIGLLAVQILRANGCLVLGIDIDDRRVALARKFGAEALHVVPGVDPFAAGRAFSDGAGVDGVLITASTTSSEPVTQAAQMSRKRGRIVLVGVTGLELNRADFYEKELSFRVSCSYGPGRYDSAYEERGQDYPLGFVRWTEQRNFAAVLDLMASGAIDVAPLISHRFAIAEAQSAYNILAADASVLGIVIGYSAQSSPELPSQKIAIVPGTAPMRRAGDPVIGLIGAGNFCSRVVVPILRKISAQPKTVVSQSGMTAFVNGRKAQAEFAATDLNAVFGDPSINTVIIATRHDSHAALVVRALDGGKNVFVEKPLALSAKDIGEIETVYAKSQDANARPLLMIGFNRRFAPLTQRMKLLLERTAEPKAFIITVNAGPLPANHWALDPEKGGGRIIGEACHFIDLMRFLAGASITNVDATTSASSRTGSAITDVTTITLKFADGSHGAIHYFANGNNQFPKERVEVFVGGRVLQLDNFRRLRAFGWPGFGGMSSWRQDKGHKACLSAFVSAIRAGASAPIAASEIFEVSRRTIEAAGLCK